MSKPIDYSNEVRLFQALKAKGQKLTQAAFCQMRSTELGQPISPKYFNRVLSQIKSQKSSGSKKTKSTSKTTHSKRRDWTQLKSDFMAGKHKTISDLARHCGLHASSSFFRKKTAGWTAERAKIEQKVDAAVVDRLVESGVARKIRNLYADALVAYVQIFEAMEAMTHDPEKWTGDKTPERSWMGAKFLNELRDGITKILPVIKGLEKLEDINKIFDSLSANEIDITQASLALVRLGVSLPKPLEIMLSKHVPDEVVPDDGEEINEATILERRRTMLLEIEEEKKRLIPDREAFVNRLKAERKEMDSFTAEAMGRK